MVTKVRRGTFQELMRSGSSIAATIEIEREDFDGLIQQINARFGTQLICSDRCWGRFKDRIRFVAGRFQDHAEAVDRRSVEDRLKKLTGNVQTIIASLSPVRSGIHDGRDCELISYLEQVIAFGHECDVAAARLHIETLLKVAEGLEVHCERGLVLLSQIPSKKGQRGNSWYDDFVELMSELAGELGMKVSTAGDRSEDPSATPFTMMVFALEKVLPEGAQSNTLAACAKRIQRSLRKVRLAAGQNARAP